MGSEGPPPQRFETLQLHAGCDILTMNELGTDKVADKLTFLCRQEPDKATNARAVPIYATTVIVIGPLNWSKRVDVGNFRASSSMIALMALDFSVSRSSATSTAAS